MKGAVVLTSIQEQQLRDVLSFPHSPEAVRCRGHLAAELPQSTADSSSSAASRDQFTVVFFVARLRATHVSHSSVDSWHNQPCEASLPVRLDDSPCLETGLTKAPLTEPQPLSEVHLCCGCCTCMGVSGLASRDVYCRGSAISKSRTKAPDAHQGSVAWARGAFASAHRIPPHRTTFIRNSQKSEASAHLHQLFTEDFGGL